MKLIKLTAFTSLLFACSLGFVSCEKNAEKKKTTDFEKKEIPMTGAQVVPGNASSALGSLDVFYSKETRVLSYKVSWSGLSDSVAHMRIHGLAPAGFAATPSATYPTGVVQSIVTTGSTTVFAQKTGGKFTFHKSGTLTGTILADGVYVKEQDILNGMYYISIYPNTPALLATTGELRGQIRFQ